MSEEEVQSTFVVLYRGSTVATARIVAMSADRALTAYVARMILREDSESPSRDPVLRAKRSGQRAALRVIVDEGRPDRVES